MSVVIIIINFLFTTHHKFRNHHLSQRRTLELEQNLFFSWICSPWWWQHLARVAVWGWQWPAPPPASSGICRSSNNILDTQHPGHALPAACHQQGTETLVLSMTCLFLLVSLSSVVRCPPISQVCGLFSGMSTDRRCKRTLFSSSDREPLTLHVLVFLSTPLLQSSDS